jgi:hypothetical protein
MAFPKPKHRVIILGVRGDTTLQPDLCSVTARLGVLSSVICPLRSRLRPRTRRRCGPLRSALSRVC